MSKTWKDIEKEVEQEMLDRFNSVPIEQRAKLGLESNTRQSHENRQWVQVFVQMLTWKNKCPAKTNKKAGKKKRKLKSVK